ncbi:MAG: oxygen-independent coproporphyrinogen III oxidase [Rubrivivax sp.]|nr:oxygen-independent coproporphyrinogen III oxidase [Rubrivivax sp.]
MTDAAVALPEPLIRRHDRPGPRYTSYPTADRFADHFSPAHLAEALSERRRQAEAGEVPPLSLYVHIPFCEQLCYYCACNKVITKHHERALPYLQSLSREIGMTAALIEPNAVVQQLHLGGGSPTFLSDDELSRVMQMLLSHYVLADAAEVSIEVDPRTVTAERLAHLRAIGFNRLSFGVQDFDPDVQQAVHRVQPYEQVQALMEDARRLGFASINVDLIYGLPKQTPASFARTLAQVSTLRPDRIALYAYAHLPERFKPQRRIHAIELPAAADRAQMLASAITAFREQGYTHIGMDHFALENDELAVAKREGRLRRNFQGYSTQPDGDLIALGVSAISHVGGCYAQNAKTVEQYDALLADGRLPVVRGMAATADDRVRRQLIMWLMCQGHIDFDAAERALGISLPGDFAPEFERLQVLQEQGLVELGPRSVGVTPLGWYFIRVVAMVFDAYLARGGSTAQFSKVL